MGYAVLDADDSLGTGSNPIASRQLERGTIFQVSLSLMKLGNWLSNCGATLFISSGDTNLASATLIFFEGSLEENAPFLWQGDYEIEGWETVVLRTFGGYGHHARAIINIKFKPI